MEPNSRKNDDCYFYYYSTCLKGENCLFRHEENALGCEVVCQYWKEGKCLNERCNFRHMELKKNRKVIPCYWETQPSGCRKPHCPFRHMNQQKDKPPDKSKDGNVSNSNIVMSGGVLNVPGSTAGRNPSTDGSVPGPTVVRGDINYSANPVDPIVVKFEEGRSGLWRTYYDRRPFLLPPTYQRMPAAQSVNGRSPIYPLTMPHVTYLR